MRRTLVAVCGAILLISSAPHVPAPIIEETTPQPSIAPKRKVQSKSLSMSKSAPGAEAGMSSRSVQVVLTENTKAAMVYLKNYEDKPFSDVRPDEILEQLKRALSTRFSNVSIVGGGSAFRGGSLTMLFDLQAHVGSISFTTNTISFVATFQNSTGRIIQTISASGKSTVPYPAFSNQFSKAVSKAFADFSQKLNAAR